MFAPNEGNYVNTKFLVYGPPKTTIGVFPNNVETVRAYIFVFF